MRKVLRWLGYLLALLVMLALLFAAWVWFASSRVLGRTHEAAAERLAAPSAAQRADAGRQARILGCTHCHGARLEGRMMFDGQPFATAWAPNLTELAARASDQQLAQAIRQGIGHDGRALFAMPSELYARLSDGEVAALVAHLRGLPRVGERVSAIIWGPIGRFALASGGLAPAAQGIEDYRVRQPFDVGPEHRAGRRLAATTCAGCHGPDLSGSPDTPDLAIAGAYDLAQFRTLMRTGRPPGGRDLGLMGDLARVGFSNFTDEELAQLHAYLQARAQRVAQ